MSEDSSGGAMTVGDYLGKARAVTVEFCQVGERTMAIVGWKSREGEGVLEIPSR